MSRPFRRRDKTVCRHKYPLLYMIEWWSTLRGGEGGRFCFRINYDDAVPVQDKRGKYAVHTRVSVCGRTKRGALTVSYLAQQGLAASTTESENEIAARAWRTVLMSLRVDCRMPGVSEYAISIRSRYWVTYARHRVNPNHICPRVKKL